MFFQVFKCECNSNAVDPSVVAQKLYYTTDDKNITEIALINEGMISLKTWSQKVWDPDPEPYFRKGRKLRKLYRMVELERHFIGSMIMVISKNFLVTKRTCGFIQLVSHWMIKLYGVKQLKILVSFIVFLFLILIRARKESARLYITSQRTYRNSTELIVTPTFSTRGQW